MMAEWATYGLQDLLLFSPATYFRLLQAHNGALWPLHLLTVASGLSIPILLRSGWPQRHRVVGLVLAANWLWVAWSFLLERYATLHWAAGWFAALFAVQAALSLLVGFGRRRLGFGRPWGGARTALSVLFLLAQPVAGLLAGRPLAQAEVFGILPDPTAMGALASAVFSPRLSAWLLAPIPVLWCVTAGSTLWAMGTPDSWVPPVMALVAVVILLRGMETPPGAGHI